MADDTPAESPDEGAINVPGSIDKALQILSGAMFGGPTVVTGWTLVVEGFTQRGQLELAWEYRDGQPYWRTTGQLSAIQDELRAAVDVDAWRDDEGNN